MEVVVWYLAVRGGKCSNRWYVHLTDFSDESLVSPLYAILLGGGEAPPVFDVSVYRDPRLSDTRLWDGTEMKEVKRVNPDLVRLLAGLRPNQTAAAAEAWYDSAPFQDFFHGRAEGHGRREVNRMLAELPPLARQARKRGKDVFQDFWWQTD